MTRPTHKKCLNCREWFWLKPRANRRQRFCTRSCWATYRNAQPKWKKVQSQKARTSANPEVMRERARRVWRDPDRRARLLDKLRARANTKEHLAWMVEHNKRIWADPE